MLIRQAQPGRVFAARLPKGADLLAALTELCAVQGVNHGEVTAIGALTEARLGYYNQERRRYEIITVAAHCEIVSLVGNISLKDGRPFVHAHLAVAGADGRVSGGHLVEGCPVFAGEAVVRELDVAEPLERDYDGPTGLALWRP